MKMPLSFDNFSEKIATCRAFNDLLRAAGKPAAHEGLQETDPLLFNIYACIDAVDYNGGPVK
jgi:hypothetical protein